MNNLDSEQLLLCGSCGHSKPTSAFAVETKTKRGYQTKCRDCHKAYYQANKAAYARRFQVFKQEHNEELRDYMSRYRISNRDAVTAYASRHYHANKDKHKHAGHKRRVSMHSNGPVEYITIVELYTRDQGICGCCQEAVEANACGNMQPSIDHKIPVSKGGTHTWNNVQLAHLICNIRKGAKLQCLSA